MMSERNTMNGKPVFTVPAKSVINFESGFKEKLLCDGATFSAGTACVYRCAFCYVPEMMRKQRATPSMAHVKGEHMDIVVRRDGALEALRAQLTDRHGKSKFNDPADRRVIYSSPLVDVAGNLELVRETIEICKVILELTNWQIRLLSKSNLLHKIGEAIEDADPFPGHKLSWKQRMIFGVSTGTLDDKLAKAFEEGTPLVSRRLESLHYLQDEGFRTFGMICPSLPQKQYMKFAAEMAAAIRVKYCEHVWAEVINVRGESMIRTVKALERAGFKDEADALQEVSLDREVWEYYAQRTFTAHRHFISSDKLRFLQYVTNETRPWWTAHRAYGAVLL